MEMEIENRFSIWIHLCFDGLYDYVRGMKPILWEVTRGCLDFGHICMIVLLRVCKGFRKQIGGSEMIYCENKILFISLFMRLISQSERCDP